MSAAVTGSPTTLIARLACSHQSARTQESATSSTWTSPCRESRAQGTDGIACVVEGAQHVEHRGVVGSLSDARTVDGSEAQRQVLRTPGAHERLEVCLRRKLRGGVHAETSAGPAGLGLAEGETVRIVRKRRRRCEKTRRLCDGLRAELRRRTGRRWHRRSLHARDGGWSPTIWSALPRDGRRARRRRGAGRLPLGLEGRRRHTRLRVETPRRPSARSRRRPRHGLCVPIQPAARRPSTRRNQPLPSRAQPHSIDRRSPGSPLSWRQTSSHYGRIPVRK